MSYFAGSRGAVPRCDSLLEVARWMLDAPRAMTATIPEDEVIDKVLAGDRISRDEALRLYALPLNELGELANHRRNLASREKHGGRGEEIVTYIVDRNINYTNVCDVYCKFCAFYRTEKDADHYVITHEELDRKLDELTAIGGIQILMQGGHHPSLGIDWYLDLLAHIREKYPHINIHGFSPPEFTHFAKTFEMPLREVLTKFKAAGLGSVPGGGGEILVDRVREAIAPLKCTSDQWLEVMAVAHELGLNSSATMMFGHVENLDERIEHLDRLRVQQDETGGFTAFICWTFQPGRNRAGNVMLPGIEPVGSSEYLRMQALSRIYLDNIPNLQSSWVTQGPKIGQVALKYGANDFGSVMMEENVVSAAGTSFRLQKEQIELLIRDAGFEARQRNNWYRLVE